MAWHSLNLRVGKLLHVVHFEISEARLIRLARKAIDNRFRRAQAGPISARVIHTVAADQEDQ